jgi:hypothetical protein
MVTRLQLYIAKKLEVKEESLNIFRGLISACERAFFLNPVIVEFTTSMVTNW